jgi:hypothetical protein
VWQVFGIEIRSSEAKDVKLVTPLFKKTYQAHCPLKLVVSMKISDETQRRK